MAARSYVADLASTVFFVSWVFTCSLLLVYFYVQVKKPVICANYHVFCSSCMEMWLKKASQCPTCRVPITTDNPCREIIGEHFGIHTNTETSSLCISAQSTNHDVYMRHAVKTSETILFFLIIATPSSYQILVY